MTTGTSIFCLHFVIGVVKV